MSTLTLTEAKAMVAEILLSQPDARFGPGIRLCRYFNEDGSPDCCVGHVLSRVGITREDVKGFDVGTPNDPNSAVFDLLHPLWSGDIDPAAGKFLIEVQHKQDSGVTWREVYEHFFGEDADQ